MKHIIIEFGFAQENDIVCLFEEGVGLYALEFTQKIGNNFLVKSVHEDGKIVKKNHKLIEEFNKNPNLFKYTIDVKK